MVRDRTPSPEIPRFREISRTSCRKMATKLGLAMAYVLCLAVSANADFVSGRVYDPNNQPVPNMTFTAGAGKGQAVSFKTDGSGNFSVYLDPGTYTVHPSGDKSLEGVIHGYPQAAQEDIHMKRK